MADPLFVKIHVWSWFKLNDCFLFWRLQNHKAMREPDVSPHFWHELRSSQVKHAGGLMVRLIPNLFDLWIYLIQYEPLMKSTLDPGSMDFIGFDLRAMVVLASKIVCPSRAQLGCGDHTILVWDGFLEINMVLTRLSVASDVGFQPKKTWGSETGAEHVDGYWHWKFYLSHPIQPPINLCPVPSYYDHYSVSGCPSLCVFTCSDLVNPRSQLTHDVFLIVESWPFAIGTIVAVSKLAILSPIYVYNPIHTFTQGKALLKASWLRLLSY